MSNRRNTATARALHAGHSLHDLLAEAHLAAEFGSPEDNRPDPMAAVVAVLVQALLDAATPYAAGTEEHRARLEERRARAEARRRRLWDIVNTHPCPTCQAPAGSLCLTLTPNPHPKQITTNDGVHAARRHLATEAAPTEEGADPRD